ncbi:MAG: Mov34/MPN/PAD-1 family protein [Promethearchaeota archaeon]
MENLKEQYQNIIEHYPNVILVDNLITHLKIPIKNGSFIEINYSNYPKKPQVILINQKGEMNKKIENIIPSLYLWKRKKAPMIIEIINDIIIFINNITLNEIFIKKELLNGIFGLCQEHHPNEILGLLRVEGNIVTEFILPPGALTNTSSGVFFPNRIPFDLSLKGTVHSHPTGNPNPSSKDLQSIFKKMQFHFIIGYPYNLNCTKCFDRKGNEINFKTIS